MSKNYIAPTVEMESLCVEQGIAMSTQSIESSLISDIYVTEENVEW